MLLAPVVHAPEVVRLLHLASSAGAGSPLGPACMCPPMKRISAAPPRALPFPSLQHQLQLEALECEPTAPPRGMQRVSEKRTDDFDGHREMQPRASEITQQIRDVHCLWVECMEHK